MNFLNSKFFVSRHLDDKGRHYILARPKGFIGKSFEDVHLSLRNSLPQIFNPEENYFSYFLALKKWFLRASQESTSSPHDDDAQYLSSCNDFVLVGAALEDIETLFFLSPNLNLMAPLNTHAHIVLRKDYNPTGIDSRILKRKIETGSPFRKITLYSDDASAVAAQLDIPVYQPPVHKLSCFHEMPLSKTVESFGPAVVIITALWGRSGSSTIFESQTRYFLDRGYFVIRVYLDHYPESGQSQYVRIRKFAQEDFQKCAPHIFTVCERDTSGEYLKRISQRPDYLQGSALQRTVAILSEPVPREPSVLEWIKSLNPLVVVNHTMHIEFGAKLSTNQIILETHDVFSDLLSSHGIPHFTPVDRDTREMRVSEEKLLWRRASACVNLSPADHQLISSYSNNSFFIRPYPPRRSKSERTWEQVCLDNDLDPVRFGSERFDIVLWGTWHQGNIDGIHWFLREIAPLHEKLRSSNILVVGRVANGLKRSVLVAKNVYCTGAVDRIEDFLTRATVAVIPDRSSTGVSIKAMDACSLGLPLVSTKEGLRTLSTDHTSIVGHSSASSMASEILLLLTSAEEREKRAGDSTSLYEKNFSKEFYERSWDEVIQSIS